jgi:hypothetical protein
MVVDSVLEDGRFRTLVTGGAPPGGSLRSKSRLLNAIAGSADEARFFLIDAAFCRLGEIAKSFCEMIGRGGGIEPTTLGLRVRICATRQQMPTNKGQ